MSTKDRSRSRILLRATPLILSGTALSLAGCGPSREDELTQQLEQAKAEAALAKTAQQRAEQKAADARASAQPAPIFVDDDGFQDDENFEDDEDSQGDEDDQFADNGSNGQFDLEDGEDMAEAEDRQERRAPSGRVASQNSHHIPSKPVY